jgi:hypothetical protein
MRHLIRELKSAEMVGLLSYIVAYLPLAILNYLEKTIGDEWDGRELISYVLIGLFIFAHLNIIYVYFLLIKTSGRRSLLASVHIVVTSIYLLVGVGLLVFALGNWPLNFG